MGSSPGHFAAFHASHLMTPRHPPRALGSLTTPIRHRLGQAGRSQPTSPDLISHGPFLPLLECGPRLATLRPLAPSNDPHGPCGDVDCSPSPDGRGSKRSTFVDDLKIATIPPNSLLELVRTTELSKSGRRTAFQPSPRFPSRWPGGDAAVQINWNRHRPSPRGEKGRPGHEARATWSIVFAEPSREAGGARRFAGRVGADVASPHGTPVG